MRTQRQPKTSHANTGRAKKRRSASADPGGQRDPFARRAAELRQVLLGCLTAEDWAIIHSGMMALAQAGSLQPRVPVAVVTVTKR